MTNGNTGRSDVAAAAGVPLPALSEGEQFEAEEEEAFELAAADEVPEQTGSQQPSATRSDDTSGSASRQHQVRACFVSMSRSMMLLCA
jgi:hypothetical protein